MFNLQTVSGGFQPRIEAFSKKCIVLLAFFLPISTTLTTVLLLLLAGSWLLSGNLLQKVKFIWQHPIGKATLFLFGMFLIGGLYSKGNREDIFESIRKMDKLLFILIIMSLSIEKKWRHRAIWAFVSAMILTLLLSIFKVYGRLPNYTPNYTLACVFKDHIYTGLMMTFSVFIMGHYVFNRSYGALHVVYGLLIACTFYVFFMSRGRIGYIIFTALLLLFCFQRLKVKHSAIVFLMLIVFLIFSYMCSVPFKEGINLAINDFKQYKMENNNTSVGLRLEYIKQTLKLSQERSWFGYGTGSFKKEYQKNASLNNLTHTNNPHNEYVNILLQLGTFGLSSLLVFFGMILKASFSLPKQEKWLAQGMLLSMVLGCLANSWLMDFTSGYFFVLLIGLCFSSARATVFYSPLAVNSVIK